MNKLKIYGYGIFLVVSFVFTGCDDFLSQAPDERLAIDNLEKINQTLTGAYQNSRAYRFTHWCSDDVTRTEGVYETDPIIDDLYSWSQNIRTQKHQDSPSEYWRSAYASIAAVNHALQAMEELKISAADKEKADAIKGEALIMRSYCHFMLVNLFSKHYDQETADSDLGVPYITTPENKLRVDYERETVENAYLLAEKDLLDGIELLEESRKSFKTNKYRFTFPSVYLYASRFYTFRNKDSQDVEQSIYFAEKSINAFGGVGVMRNWGEYAKDNNGPIDVAQGEIGMVQNARTWTSFDWKYQSTLAIESDQWRRNPIGFTDIRVRGVNYKRSGDIAVPAFYFVYVPGDGELSAIDIFPIAEAVLNAAEGYARSGNNAKAIDYIGYIGEKVYGNFSKSSLTIAKLKNHFKTTDDKEALIKTVLFERRVQFLFKGMRWFDIRRYQLEVEHVWGEDDGILKLSEVNPNRCFQLPNYAIASGIKPNK